MPHDLAHDAPLIDHRLTELEMKLTYTEDLVDALNLAVARQQDQIAALLSEVQQLRDQVGQGGSQPTFRSLRDELPPHY